MVAGSTTMREVTLQIPDNKYQFFMELVHNLGFDKAEDHDIPEWHKEVIDLRMSDYKKNPDQVMDFDQAMDEIEKNL